MVDLDKELVRAMEEVRAGSHDRALAILDTLRTEFSKPAATTGLSEQERLHGLVKIFNNLGIVQKNCGRLEEATRHLEEALKIAVKLGDETIPMRTGILSNLGLLYSRRKQYAKALDAFDEALKLALEHTGELAPNLTVKLYNNRALFFVRFGEPERARDELAQALEAGHDKTANGSETEREAWLNANLAMIHAELGQEEVFNPSRQEELYRQARTMFLRSADLYGHAGYFNNRLKQLVNAAEINIRLRAVEEARRLLHEARREAERVKDGRLLCEIAQVCVELALITPDRENLLNQVREAIRMLGETNPPDLPTRWTRLEGVLRRAGKSDALALLSDFRSIKGSDRNSKKPSPT